MSWINITVYRRAQGLRWKYILCGKCCILFVYVYGHHVKACRFDCQKQALIFYRRVPQSFTLQREIWETEEWRKSPEHCQQNVIFTSIYILSTWRRVNRPWWQQLLQREIKRQLIFAERFLVVKKRKPIPTVCPSVCTYFSFPYSSFLTFPCCYFVSISSNGWER